MSIQRKHKVNATELAQVLLNDFVNNTTLDAKPNLTMEADKESYYRAKSRIYRVALVLIALISEEQQDPQFSKVKESLEVLVFPEAQEEGILFLEEIKSAMRHLSELLFPAEQPREMSWALNWLHGIDIEETNPVTLSLFAMRWMDSYVMIKETLGEFNLT